MPQPPRRPRRLGPSGARARLRACALAAAALVLAFAPAALAAPPLLGAYVDLAPLAPAAREAELDRLSSAGVATLRMPLDWNRVEPEPGRFVWSQDDAAVDAARARGLDVLLVLGACAEWAVDPAWEVPPDQRARSVPRSLDLWERYVREALSHFRGRLRHWQIREQPNVRNFRGSRPEYLSLLDSAARVARQVNPSSLIVLPESGHLDLGSADALARSPHWRSFDILGLHLTPAWRDLSTPALAHAVLAGEVLPDAPGGARPTWVLGGGDLSADQWLQHYLLAWAFGIARVYLPPAAISRDWTHPLSRLDYLGFLRLGPEVWALAFEGPDGPVVIAWADRDLVLRAEELSPIADEAALREAAPLGGAPGAALGRGAGETTLMLGPRPVLARGLAPYDSLQARAPRRRDVLAARPGPDLSRLPLVWADYAMQAHPEFGLRNRALRELPGGAAVEEERAGRLCLRTRMRPARTPEEVDDPWLYFDVDDSWLYLARGRTPVAITIECDGSFLGAERLGFNIYYDSVTGYRFTPWQWVEPPSGQWRRYRVELDDVSFANRDGYDFRINVKGSKQDIWVPAVTVEKLPGP